MKYDSYAIIRRCGDFALSKGKVAKTIESVLDERGVRLQTDRLLERDAKFTLQNSG